MTTTLLQGVNGVLKRVGKIAGDAGELTSLTDSPRQHFVDTAVDAWNDTLDEFFRLIGRARPNVLSENTITLATGDRDYALQTNLTKLFWPLLDETNGQYIVEFPPGYEALVAQQPFPANHTGLPYNGVIRPTDGELYLDAIPTSEENGRIYKYRYQKDTLLSLAADTMPVSDIVARRLEPAAVEIWRRMNRENFSESEFERALGNAASYIRTEAQPATWLR